MAEKPTLHAFLPGRGITCLQARKEPTGESDQWDEQQNKAPVRRDWLAPWRHHGAVPVEGTWKFPQPQPPSLTVGYRRQENHEHGYVPTRAHAQTPAYLRMRIGRYVA